MENLKEKIEIERGNILKLEKEIQKKIVGQDDMVRKILIGILTGNHILLEGLPGLAKSLTVNTLAQTLGLKFSRIQFTPDLLPSDIIGTEIYNEKTGEFYTKKGPIFANIILADEINRAPAKVQSALLEAMQEKQITIANETFKLDKPFIVLATQNPIEQERIYPFSDFSIFSNSKLDFLNPSTIFSFSIPVIFTFTKSPTFISLAKRSDEIKRNIIIFFILSSSF